MKGNCYQQLLISWVVFSLLVKVNCCQVTSVVSDSVRPHRRQSTRLPRLWDSPGKNTGVGCHFLLQCMKVKSESEVTSVVSDSLRPHRLQPTRLLCPWDFPGKTEPNIHSEAWVRWGGEREKEREKGESTPYVDLIINIKDLLKLAKIISSSLYVAFCL